MADQTRSAESGASTANNTPSASAVVHPGASASETMLWAPALLSAGDEGSTSSTFRLPELAPSSDAHAGGQLRFHEDDPNLLELWVSKAQTPQPNYSEAFHQPAIELPTFAELADTTNDLGVYMRHHNPVAKLPSAAHANLPLACAPFEANSRPTPTPTHQPRDDVQSRRMLASGIHAANAALTRTEGHAFHPRPRNPVPAPNHAHISATTRQTLLRALGANSPAPAWQHQQTLASDDSPSRRSQPTSDRAPVYALTACPPYHTATPNFVVPHASIVSMPTIGNVAGYLRTPDAFQELTSAPHLGAIRRPLPVTRLLPRPATPAGSTPFRYPRIRTAPTHPPLQAPTGGASHAPARPWQRSTLAADHASSIWNCEPARYVRVSDPTPTLLYRTYVAPPGHGLRTCRVMAVEDASGARFAPTAMGPPTPQVPTAGYAGGPALNTNGTPRARRGAATDSQSVYARRRRVKISERIQILQRLIPNGTKVDLVAMLGEAFNYVKFLEQQIQLLKSEDKWMLATPNTYKGTSHHL